MVLNTKGIHNSFWRNFLAKAKQMPSKVLFVGKKMPVGNSKWVKNHQPRTQACSRYPSDQRSEFSRQAWQVTSHPKSPRTTGKMAEKSSFLCSIVSLFYYILKQLFTSVSVDCGGYFPSLLRGLVNREFTQRRRRQQQERLKSKIFRQAKQHLCTYISLPSLHDYNVELPNFTFCRGREQKTTTFFFFTWTLMQSFRVHLQKICQHLTNWTRWNKRD